MKKYIYCVFIALITLACNQDDELSINKTALGIPDTFYGQTPVYKSRALTDVQPESWDETENVNSRTYAVKDENGKANPELGIQGEYYQYWEENDEISVFFTTQNLKYKLNSYKNNKDHDVGVFKLADNDNNATTGSDFSTGYYYSVYPYKETTSIAENGFITYNFPETQHYNQHINETLENVTQGDSYSNGENAMLAVEPKEGTDYTLYYKNFCSYLQLSLIDTDKNCQTFIDENGNTQPKKVTSIKLVANNPADKLSGTCLVIPQKNENEVEDNTHTPYVDMRIATDATNRITLDCGNGISISQDENNPTKFWFVLPGEFTFTKGFVVTVIFNDGTYFRQVTTKEISIQRSHIKPMKAVNPDPSLPKGPIIYRYNDYTNNTDPFPVNNTFYGEDGLQLEVIGQRYIEEYNEWMILLSGTLKAIGSNSFLKDIYSVDMEYVKVDNNMQFGRVDNEEGNEISEGESISINDHAFYNCSAELVEIFNDVVNIDYQAFDGSTITDLKIHGDVTTFAKNAGAGSKIKNIEVDGNVKKFDFNAFNNCDYLETINILSTDFDTTNNVNTIGSQAFNDCDNLKEVNYPMVNTIESGAFDGCNKLETIDIQEARTIGSQAFNGCNSLKSVKIIQVDRIASEAFQGCSMLNKIDLSSVEYIENKAFYTCYGLTSVDLRSIIEIGRNAFSGASMETITIPESCTKIGEGAFNDCNNLKTVYCHAIKPPYIDSDNENDAIKDSFVFGQVINKQINIYVPKNSITNYTSLSYFYPKTNWWYNYSSRIFALENITNP